MISISADEIADAERAAESAKRVFVASLTYGDPECVREMELIKQRFFLARATERYLSAAARAATLDEASRFTLFARVGRADGRVLHPTSVADWFDAAVAASMAHDSAVQLGHAAAASEWMDRRTDAVLMRFRHEMAERAAATLPLEPTALDLGFTLKEAAVKLDMKTETLKSAVRRARPGKMFATLRGPAARIGGRAREKLKTSAVNAVKAALDAHRADIERAKLAKQREFEREIAALGATPRRPATARK